MSVPGVKAEVGWTYNPFGLPAVISAVLMLATAAVVLFVRPTSKMSITANSRTPNIRLAVFLAAEGLTVGSGLGLIYMADSVQGSYLWQAVQVAAGIMVPAAQLLFLATLEGPFARILRDRRFQWTVVALTLAAEAVWLLRPDWFLHGTCDSCWYAAGADPGAGEYPGWEWDVALGYRITIAIAGIVSLFGLVVAVFAVRRARLAVDRHRARAFAVAFGFRDALYGINLTTAYQFYEHGQGSRLADWYFHAGAAVVELVFVGLMVHGMLSTQLFGVTWKRLRAFFISFGSAVLFVTAFVAAEEFQRMTGSSNVVLAGTLAATWFYADHRLDVRKRLLRLLRLPEPPPQHIVVYQGLARDLLLDRGDSDDTRLFVDAEARGMGLTVDGDADHIYLLVRRAVAA